MSVLDDYLVDPRLSLLDKTRIQAQVLVPVLRALRSELGKEKADAIVKQALRDWSKQLFAAIGHGIEGSPRRHGRPCTPRWPVTERGDGGNAPTRRGSAGFDVTHCRFVEFFARSAAGARRAADLRARFRYCGGGRQRGQLDARPDHYAGRIELHVPLQVRTAITNTS